MEEIGTPSLTWRMLAIFMERLPRDSCLARAMAPDEKDWDLQAHLMAEIADRLAIGNWLAGQQLTAWAAKGTKNPVPEPKPIPRPGVAKDEQEQKPATRGMKALIRRIDPTNAAKAGA